MVELINQSSTCECSHFIDSLKGRKMFDAVYHTGTIKELRERMKVWEGRKIFEKTWKICNTKFSTTHALGCNVGGLIHSRHDESCDSLGWLACAGFQPSNVCDEQHINPCWDNGGKDESNKITESQTGVQCEISSNRDHLLIRGFWDKNTDCIIDVRICDVNRCFVPDS